MTELIVGIISGVVASIMVYIFLLLVRPKIYVSDKICKTVENGQTIFRIKVVNKTRYMLTNVKYTLNYCEKSGDGVHNVKEIPPLKTPLIFIDKYSRKDVNAEYAIRFTYPAVSDIITEQCWLEFSIYANHGFSNTTACVKKKYDAVNISPGIFETGTSMRILAIPNQGSS